MLSQADPRLAAALVATVSAVAGATYSHRVFAASPQVDYKAVERVRQTAFSLRSPVVEFAEASPDMLFGLHSGVRLPM